MHPTVDEVLIKQWCGCPTGRTVRMQRTLYL